VGEKQKPHIFSHFGKKIQQLVKFNQKKIVEICKALVRTSTPTSVP
jgi:hypothetical protein